MSFREFLGNFKTDLKTGIFQNKIFSIIFLCLFSLQIIFAQKNSCEPVFLYSYIFILNLFIYLLACRDLRIREILLTYISLGIIFLACWLLVFKYNYNFFININFFTSSLGIVFCFLFLDFIIHSLNFLTKKPEIPQGKLALTSSILSCLFIINIYLITQDIKILIIISVFIYMLSSWLSKKLLTSNFFQKIKFSYLYLVIIYLILLFFIILKFFDLIIICIIISACCFVFQEILSESIREIFNKNNNLNIFNNINNNSLIGGGDVCFFAMLGAYTGFLNSIIIFQVSLVLIIIHMSLKNFYIKYILKKYTKNNNNKNNFNLAFVPYLGLATQIFILYKLVF